MAYDRDTLMAAARDAIAAAITGRPPDIAAAEQAPDHQALGASFVTLLSPDGSLRGCIGELSAQRPLIASVRHCARGAALRDPRFSPVEAAELDELQIGISVLSPPRAASPIEVEVGHHGVIIVRGMRRGVLLPEVASDNGWDRETLLRAVCRKAGLPLEAWADPDAQLSVFTTDKISTTDKLGSTT